MTATRTPAPRPTFTVIPCGGGKLDHAAPARDLYTGAMFRSTLAAAEAEAPYSGATILILSALHGLVTLDTVLAPYDVKMGDPGSVTADTLAAQAVAHGMDWTDESGWASVDVYAFLPAAYFNLLDEALRTIDVYPAQVFEADRGIGEQRKTNRIVRETPDPEPIIDSMLADLDPEDAEWVRRWSPGGRRSHAA